MSPCTQRNMKRRGGKREVAGQKKSSVLAKITREKINKKHWRANPRYTFGKSSFLNLGKGSCRGNLLNNLDFVLWLVLLELNKKNSKYQLFFYSLDGCSIFLYWKEMF